MNLLTVSEVAARLNVSDDLVRKLIAQRVIEARNVTPKSRRATYRIEEAEVERFLGLTKPDPPSPRRAPRPKAAYREYF